MPVDEISLVLGLVAANAALYMLLALGLVRAHRTSGIASDSREVFRRLEKTVSAKRLDLPEGYTWREAFAALRRSLPWLEWEKIEAELSDYERYRYGEIGEPAHVTITATLLKLIKKVGHND
jgi:hypothetical protein